MQAIRRVILDTGLVYTWHDGLEVDKGEAQCCVRKHLRLPDPERPKAQLKGQKWQPSAKLSSAAFAGGQTGNVVHHQVVRTRILQAAN